MVVTLELSMYPFRESFTEPIHQVIDRLRGKEDLKVEPGPTSTVVFGEHERVMAALSELLAWSHAEHGRSVFVAKFLVGYDPF